MMRVNDIPADFIEEISYFSARLPNTITDAINIVTGTASGIIRTEK